MQQELEADEVPEELIIYETHWYDKFEAPMLQSTEVFLTFCRPNIKHIFLQIFDPDS